MLKLAVCSVLALVVYAAYYEDSASYWVHKINNDDSSFQAGHNPYFAQKSRDDVRRLMGAWLGKEGLKGVPEKVPDERAYTYLPRSFTAGKDKWPECADTIGFIKDQANCGSCWAVAASNVVAARICITNYAYHAQRPEFLNEKQPAIDMSAEDILACCKADCGAGCGGGWPAQAMKYYAEKGVPTGGWYQSNCGCMPYKVGHYSSGETPACETWCRYQYDSPTYKAVSDDKHFAASHYSIQATEKAVMQEIYDHGPVECAFTVYENFMHYTGGVYDRIEGRQEGGHAITVIGWGEQNGTPYWLINNSWNITWGDHGQIKFLRGSNLCGIESLCVAAAAKPNDSKYLLKC